MPRIALVLSLALALLAIVPLRDRFWSHRSATPFDAQVVAVLDGDTVIVRMPKGGEERVRVIGVDTPEISHDGKPRQCYSLRATSFVRRVALRRHVELTPGRELRDRYGRLLAYVHVVGGPQRLLEPVVKRIGQSVNGDTRPTLEDPVESWQDERRQEGRANETADDHSGERLLNFTAGFLRKEHPN